LREKPGNNADEMCRTEKPLMTQDCRARKPDGIDFVGNSEISSFPQNPATP
jgi:hypothetical protein